MEWINKTLEEIAEELNVALNSLVFIDDYPAERKIVNDYLNGGGVKR